MYRTWRFSGAKRDAAGARVPQLTVHGSISERVCAPDLVLGAWNRRWADIDS